MKWSPSPHIYSGEPPSPRPWNQQGTLGTDVVSQSESATSKPEGGGAHGLVGRPVGRPDRSAGLPLGPPTFSLLLWAVLRAHWSMVYGLASSLLDFFSGGLLVNMWRHLIGRCLLLGTKGVIVLHFQLNPALIEI